MILWISQTVMEKQPPPARHLGVGLGAPTPYCANEIRQHWAVAKVPSDSSRVQAPLGAERRVGRRKLQWLCQGTKWFLWLFFGRDKLLMTCRQFDVRCSRPRSGTQVTRTLCWVPLWQCP